IARAWRSSLFAVFGARGAAAIARTRIGNRRAFFIARGGYPPETRGRSSLPEARSGLRALPRRSRPGSVSSTRGRRKRCGWRGAWEPKNRQERTGVAGTRARAGGKRENRNGDRGGGGRA